MKRRISNENYETDWLDITDYVLAGGLSNLRYSLDSEDFDIGFFKVSNISLTFDNSTGKFNEPEDCRSYWSSLETRNMTKFKIESGYLDENYAKLVEIVFEGFLDDRSFELNVDSDEARGLILSREYLFQTVTMDGGTLGTATLSASDAIYLLCNRPEITNHVTISEANINPGNDINLDSPNSFANQKLDDILNEIMLLTNSTSYIDESGNFIVRDRDHNPKLVWTCYLNSPNRDDNIYSIPAINNGRQRVKNYFSWSDTTLYATSDNEYSQKYGVTTKDISSDAVTSTSVRQSILNDLLTEWRFPKQELEVVTDYLANEIGFYDLVNFDVPPELSRDDNLPIWGEAIAGEAIAVSYVTSFKPDINKGYKIIAYEHNLEAFTTVLKLREIGNNLNDGYFGMVLSKAIDIEFTADTYVEIDTSTYSMDAEYCKVEILDIDNDYKTEEFTVTRPDSDTIKIEASSAITGNYRVLIMEVES
jgi:hypothetical protein